MKQLDKNAIEIKRMYTLPTNRNKGIATAILHELEKWTKELSCSYCILETGKRQQEAVELNKKNGYTIIPNYAQYIEMENSVCALRKC